MSLYVLFHIFFTDSSLVNGTEDVGGLRIVRAPSASAPELTLPTSQPTKKFRASPSPAAAAFPTHSRTTNTKKDRDRDLLTTTTREEPELEEDVRQMEDEADSLRKQGQGAMLLGEGLNPAFNFGGTSAQKPKPKPNPRSRSKSKEPSTSTSKTKIRIQDSVQELSQGDTPQMARNKLMREGKLPSQAAVGNGNGKPGGSSGEDSVKGHRRRSSTGRGKRISGLIGTGVICELNFSLSLFESIPTGCVCSSRLMSQIGPTRLSRPYRRFPLPRLYKRVANNFFVLE